MLELLLISYLELKETDIIICIYDEEKNTYFCEEEIYDGMRCVEEENVLLCERLVEV